jgi:hypothetical protein
MAMDGKGKEQNETAKDAKDKRKEGWLALNRLKSIWEQW